MLKVSAASSGPVDFGLPSTLHRDDSEVSPQKILASSSKNHTCSEIHTTSDYWYSTLEIPSTYHHWSDYIEQLDTNSTHSKSSRNEEENGNNNVLGQCDPARNDGGMDPSGSKYGGIFSTKNLVMSGEYGKQESSSDDMLLSPLDELLNASIPQAFSCDSSFSSVDDLFPSINSTSQDVLQSDIWSIESLQDLETSLSPFQSKDVRATCASDISDEDEKASQMFSEWLKRNSHYISLSDLRKIKLKTSTIETATQRLGGGKKGLLLFVRFVLMWVQNCHMKPVDSETMASISTTGGMKPCSFTQPMGSRETCYRKSTEGEHSGITSCNVKTLDHVEERWRESSNQWMMNSNPPIECNNFTCNNNAYGGAQTSLPFSTSQKGWVQQNMPSVGRESSTLPIQTPLRPTTANTDILVGQSGSQNTPSLMTLMHQQHQCGYSRPAATTRAARRSRMERQRWSVRRNRKWSLTRHHLSSVANTQSGRINAASWSQFMNTSTTQSFPSSNLRGAGPRVYKLVIDAEQLQKADKHFRLLFHKELKQSDVGNLGRIVLPKKAAETCLPPLEMRDGMNLAVEDYESANVWNVRYRFWPNNKSRMYLLENTGDFVKSHNLKEGDYIMLYFNLLSNRYVIRGAKCEEMQCGMGASLSSSVSDRPFNNNTSSKVESDLCMVPNSEECCDDSFLAELIEQSLDDFRDSPEVIMTDDVNHV